MASACHTAPSRPDAAPAAAATPGAGGSHGTGGVPGRDGGIDVGTGARAALTRAPAGRPARAVRTRRRRAPARPEARARRREHRDRRHGRGGSGTGGTTQPPPGDAGAPHTCGTDGGPSCHPAPDAGLPVQSRLRPDRPLRRRRVPGRLHRERRLRHRPGLHGRLLRDLDDFGRPVRVQRRLQRQRDLHQRLLPRRLHHHRRLRGAWPGPRRLRVAGSASRTAGRSPSAAPAATASACTSPRTSASTPSAARRASPTRDCCDGLSGSVCQMGYCVTAHEATPQCHVSTDCATAQTCIDATCE